MSETNPAGSPGGQGATFSITRRVRPGREAAYEAALQEVLGFAGRFPGIQGTQLIRPVRGSREYRVIIRFASEESSMPSEQSKSNVSPMVPGNYLPSHACRLSRRIRCW